MVSPAYRSVYTESSPEKGCRKVKLCGAEVLGFELSHFVPPSTVSVFRKESDDRL